MKHSLLMLATSLLLGGCIKPIVEGTKNNTNPDFRLELLTEELSGANSKHVETAVNVTGSAEMSAVAEVKDNKVHIRLGGLQYSSYVQPKLMATIVFKFTDKPNEIAGTYTFPADNDKVTVIFGQKQGIDWIAKWPQAQGTLKINFDAANNSWNGTLTNIEYEKPLNAPYKSQRVNGRFSHVRLR